MALDLQKLGSFFKNRDRSGYRAFKYEDDQGPNTPFKGLFDNADANQMWLDDMEEDDRPQGTQPKAVFNENDPATLTGTVAPRSRLDESRANYEDAIDAPVKKKPWWADALLKGATVLSNVMNPKKQLPVMGLGRAQHNQGVRKAYESYAPQQQLEDADIARSYKRKAIENIDFDNEEARNARKGREANQAATLAEREESRKSRVADTKMRTIASMWKTLPSFDPADSRFAAITQAMGDVELPLTPRDAKKTVKMIQDAETGAWTLTLTDPQSGQQEVRPVTNKDGSQLTTTSSSKVMANAAGERQNSSQAFQAGENAKNRREALRKWAVAHKVDKAKFAADLNAKVANGELTQDQANAALADFPDE